MEKTGGRGEERRGEERRGGEKRGGYFVSDSINLLLLASIDN